MLKNQDVSSTIQLTQRNAIYIGLTSILTEEQANAALQTWSTYFNDSTSVFNGLNSFARDVCKHYDKNDQQRELVRALNRALINKDNTITSKNTASKNIEPIESSFIEESLTPETTSDEVNVATTEQTISTPDFQTFQSLLLKLMSLIEENRKGISETLHAFLNELTESMPWSEAQQQQIFALMTTGSTSQTRTYRPDQLKSFMKHFRSWMEDEMGNAEAKRLLSEAIKATEMLPVSIKFPPKNFM